MRFQSTGLRVSNLTMKFQHCQMVFYITGVVFTTRSIASFVKDDSSKLPRQEDSSQFVRRFYHGCELALVTKRIRC